MIAIDFVDFWPGFDKIYNYLTDLLLRRYSLRICRDPDFSFFPASGRATVGMAASKSSTPARTCGPTSAYATMPSPSTTSKRSPAISGCRFTHGGTMPTGWSSGKTSMYGALAASKTRFCNFIYGNSDATRRLEFMNKLTAYKTVDCAGTLMNNIGSTVGVFEKVDFLRDYKFTIAFENASFPGYTTEKIVHAMLADSLAIYWGNPLVHLDFNPASFVNVHDYELDEAAIDRIIALDQDEALYAQCLAEPFYPGNVINRYVDPANILAQFGRIFAAGRS